MYKAEIIESVKENLTVREKLKLTDGKAATPLDAAINSAEEGYFTIEVDYYVVIKVMNDKADTPEYKKVVIVDTDGALYTTGSESFYTELKRIDDVMRAEGEVPYGISCYGVESRNYKGKSFLTCSLL